MKLNPEYGEKWYQVVEDYKTSDLTIKKHAIANDIDYYKSQYWVRKYKDLHKDQSSRFIGSVYQADNEEEAYNNLTYFKDKWDSLYPTCVKSWMENWDVISPIFKYSANVRKIMYTTNMIQNFNRQYRKIAKIKKRDFPRGINTLVIPCLCHCVLNIGSA